LLQHRIINKVKKLGLSGDQWHAGCKQTLSAASACWLSALATDKKLAFKVGMAT